MSADETHSSSSKRRLTGTMFLIGVLVILAAAVVPDWITLRKEKIYFESVLKPVSPKILELRRFENQVLGEYGLLDSAKGIYRIPIDAAIDLIVEEADSILWK